MCPFKLSTYSRNREHLSAKSICDLIQFKGSRGKPVHPLQTQMNKAIATLRYKVEQAFGTMKRRFKLDRARYFGAAKTQAQMAWAALGMNLLKALKKLQSGRLQPRPGGSPS
jgi:IS5 family transposase